jgi:hypothetical protein
VESRAVFYLMSAPLALDGRTVSLTRGLYCARSLARRKMQLLDRARHWHANHFLLMFYVSALCVTDLLECLDRVTDRSSGWTALDLDTGERRELACAGSWVSCMTGPWRSAMEAVWVPRLQGRPGAGHPSIVAQL